MKNNALLFYFQKYIDVACTATAMQQQCSMLILSHLFLSTPLHQTPLFLLLANKQYGRADQTAYPGTQAVKIDINLLGGKWDILKKIS